MTAVGQILSKKANASWQIATLANTPTPGANGQKAQHLSAKCQQLLRRSYTGEAGGGMPVYLCMALAVYLFSFYNILIC